jgi:class 3 adenylate cyclase
MRAMASAPVTVLVADISGSMLLYAVRGDEEAYRLASTCLGILEQQVGLHAGRVVKRVGDAILAAFESPDMAVRAAAAMHYALESPDCVIRDEGVRVRAGIATGTAVQESGDLYGDVVNVAARLVSLAGPDEIFLAGETHHALPADLQAPVRKIDQIALRGRPDWVEVWEYLWKQDDATVSTGDRLRVAAAALEITFGSTVLALGPERPKLTIGRGPENDITIPEEVVSRRHAEVVLRGDKFFLVDRSTNGTYVLIDGGDTFRVTREELTLAGSGRIVPGRQTVTPVRYRFGSH